MTIRIVLADDHQIFRQLLGPALANEDDIEVVGEAGDGLEAVAVTVEQTPDIVLMDISMPCLDGVEAAHRVRWEAPRARVIILSMHSDRESVERALRAGARAFVPKDAGIEELLAAIRAVNDGHRYLSLLLVEGKLNHLTYPAGASRWRT